jgi:hypothetical protein
MEEDTPDGKPSEAHENGMSKESAMGSGVYQLEGHQSEVRFC